MIVDSPFSSLESEYAEYIPSRCTFCGSTNVTETPKRTIKGAALDGYLWDISCTDCGAKWVALERPV